MSTTTVKSINGLCQYIDDIEDLEDEATKVATLLGVESLITGLGAFIPGLAGLLGTASLAAGSAGMYAGKVASTLGKFIDQLEDVEDAIQDDDAINAVKLKIYTKYDSFMDATYPKKIEVVGYHMSGSGGWIIY